MRDSGIQESGACEDFSRLVGLRRCVARNPRLNCRAIGPEHSRAFTPPSPKHVFFSKNYCAVRARTQTQRKNPA
jgi:hypothetical protein